MKNIKFFITLGFLFMVFGCNDFLDVLPDDKPVLEDAFKDQYNAEKYLFTCYHYLPSFTDPRFVLGLTGGGDIMYDDVDKAGMSGPPPTMRAYFKGNNSADPLMNYWDGSNGADRSLWEGIRHCNVFLENIRVEDGGPKDLDEIDRKQWIAEVKAIKAYMYLYLFRLYGPIPIIDKALPIASKGEQVNVHREPVDEVVNYIVKIFDEAIEDLPTLQQLDRVSEYGRFTKTIALSYKAKTLVLAASPIFNNNNYYLGIKDNRGVELFPTGDSEERWERALEACDHACRSAEEDGAIILVSTDGGQNAIPDINATNISDTTKAMISFRQAVTDSWNPEVIWATNHSVATLQQYATMLSDDEFMNRAGSGGSSLGQRHGPTLNVVERFYSSNGVPIDEDAEWLNNGWYSKRYTPKLADEEHQKYFIKKGQETALLHFNRSLRFYASVGFQGGIWEGRDKRLDQSSVPNFLKGMGCGQTLLGGGGGVGNFSPSGYLAKKLSHLKTAYAETKLTFRDERYSFPILRLADLYLLLAESLNEVGGPEKTDSKGQNAYFYLDKIRARVGLKGVVESWSNYAFDSYKNKPKNTIGLREIIRQERMNELAFEGSFYYDVRRWLIAENLLNEPTLGWNMNARNTDSFFSVTVLAQPRFTMRDYLMPIKTSTLLENPNLIQNPGWE